MSDKLHRSLRQAVRAGITRYENQSLSPRAWVYFVWIVINKQVYCKVGRSSNPMERISQVVGGVPATPFYIQLLPCLNVEQAVLFEKMLHRHLTEFRSKSKSEWFTDPNLTRLSNNIQAKVDEILEAARTFGYIIQLQAIDGSGPYPVLHPNGYINYVVDPSENPR